MAADEIAKINKRRSNAALKARPGECAMISSRERRDFIDAALAPLPMRIGVIYPPFQDGTAYPKPCGLIYPDHHSRSRHGIRLLEEAILAEREACAHAARAACEGAWAAMAIEARPIP